MDHRVFEPRPTNSRERQRSAIGMAIGVLLACLLALSALKQSGVLPGTPQTPVGRHVLQEK